MIVVDTNIIAYLYLAGERSTQVEKVFEKDPVWAAPILWRSEMLNILTLYLRKSILSLEGAQQIMSEATNQLRNKEFGIVSNQVLGLAARSSCSAYDCEFVALAQDLRVPLVTVDRQILKDFPAVSVSPESFINQ